MSFDIKLFTRRVDYTRFCRIFYALPFQRALAEAIQLKERTERERAVLPDGTERIVVYIAPRVELPAPIAKLAEGYAVGYEETILFDPAARRASSTIQTPAGDRVHVAAETLFSEDASGVHTLIKLDVRVRILGIGRVIEKFVCHETRKRYEIVERFLQQYIDEGRDLGAA